MIFNIFLFFFVLSYFTLDLFYPIIFDTYNTKVKVAKLKKIYNASTDQQTRKKIRMEINNYDCSKEKSIFLKYSTQYNAAIFVPIFFPFFFNIFLLIRNEIRREKALMNKEINDK